MLTQEDITWLTDKGFIVQPARAKEKLASLEDFSQNKFMYLENNRFLKTEFIKFPDERRQISLNDEVFEIFGKTCWDFFAINAKNEGVYLISTQEEFPLICQINENLDNFISIYYYFLMSMYQIIAEQKSLVFTDEKTYTRDTDRLYSKVSTHFCQTVKPLDAFAFPDEETPSFWRMVHDMMLEADLAFTFYNVSLLDYMQTGRFGQNAIDD